MTMQMLMADERRAGREDTEKRIIVRMYHRGKTEEDIAQDTDIPVEAVHNILKTGRWKRGRPVSREEYYQQIA